MNLAEFRARIAAIRATVDEANVLPVVVTFIRDESSSFDEGVQREADRIINAFVDLGLKNAKKIYPTLDDGPEKRMAARAIARGGGHHVGAHDLIEVLKGDTSQTVPIIAEAFDAFREVLQVCMDLLFDARQGRVSGSSEVVLHGLAMCLVDELLAAFHLAQRAFTSQAYAHIRTVEEVLDVAELLMADGDLFEQWLSATTTDAEKQLFRKLRQRVGAEVATDDSRKLYAFLSATGPHAQFRGIRARGTIEDGEGGRSATYYFLGSPKQIETANVLVVRASVATAHWIAEVFAPRLDEKDTETLLRNADRRLRELVTAHIGPMAEQMELTEEELQTLLHRRVE